MNRSHLSGRRAARLVVVCLLLLLAPTHDVLSEDGAPGPTQADIQRLQLGVLFDYSGRLGVHGPDLEHGVKLAVDQVNAAGGVLGRPVEVTIADGETDADAAVTKAREMIDSGIDALVGPMGSQAALRVGAEVSGPLRVPTVTPSATSPELSSIRDGGYLFRTALSDVAQGPVLADLAVRDGLERVSVIYQDDAYGRGLFRAFRDAFAAFAGELAAAITVSPEADSYLDELRRAAVGDSQALLLIAYPGATDILLKEALDEELFHRFFFVDVNFGPDVVLSVGAERLEGQMGTIPIGASGILPGYATVLAELKERVQKPLRQGALAAYDATVCLCLAAERAGSTDGTLLRDALFEVCGGGGKRINAGAEGVARALTAIRKGRNVDFDGATTPIDWDAAGDVTRGFVGVYRIQSGALVLVDRMAFEAA
ncbi:MAG: ABC transporter substrate-binding protein [Thermoanaerobaculia bacterium]|nr:ABC transporter substrate-binding protein [Thermoanaerobaculia bacterium]